MPSHPDRTSPAVPPGTAPGASASVRARRSRATGTGRGTLVGLPLAAIGVLSALAGVPQGPPDATPPPAVMPSPVVASAGPVPLAGDQAVQWWAAFKFNAKTFPTDPADPARSCSFGGVLQRYAAFSQRYAVSTSQDPTLTLGDGLAGIGPNDPLGATFGAIYRGKTHYVVWNDQLYDVPKIAHCTKECGSPWGHSKGVLAWNDAGEGTILQVTTPSWPAAGSMDRPRQTDGNTLGCVDDNDVLVSQDFFALKLSRDDVVTVLRALANASVVTDPSDPQLVNNGGPADIQALVSTLGAVSRSTAAAMVTLSSGVQIISKPSALHVPPWQMVSAELGGVPLKVASWWAKPQIPSTDASTTVQCWDKSLGAPGPVVIAQAGQWKGTRIGLQGGLGPDFNHAKIGYSTDGVHNFAIFGDMNQQGSLSGPCDSSQNGRGGLFFVVENRQLANSVASLLTDPAAGS